MIKKLEDNKKLNLKTKMIIVVFIFLSIIYALDKFFDNYTFVSPVKKLEFQWVIQRRKKISIDKIYNFSIYYRNNIVHFNDVKHFNLSETMNGRFLIPNIKIVGYGRTQVYQNECLKCGKLFFEDKKIRTLKSLFCEDCYDKKDEVSLLSYLKENNYSDVNYIGNVTGWVIKSDVRERRSRYNYIKVYKRDNYICQYCGYSPYYSDIFRPLHIDHIIPFSARGSNKMENLVVACSVCNLLASNKIFNSFSDKKQYIIEKLKERKEKTFFELKVKFLQKINYYG